MTVSVDPRSESVRGPALGLRDAVDAVFVLVLTGVAIFGFRTTYSGHAYLVTGVVAALIGVLITVGVAAWRKSVLVTALFAVVAFYLFSGVLVFRSEATAGLLPNLDVARDISSVAVTGWKQLLTTLPPVAGTGRLLAVPYIIGLLAGVTAASFAARTRSRLLPAVPTLLALAATILLGTSRPSVDIAQGIAFGAVAVTWAAVRRSGSRVIRVRGVPGGIGRLVVGALVLAVAGIGAAFAGPHLAGHDTKRVVLRTYVKPPFDLADYPSPLVGFRKYTKSANLLYNQPLFRTSGLPAGTTIRLAALDDYNGLVWGATNATVPAGPGEALDAFQRVGTSISSTAVGPLVSGTVTIDAGYADATDIDPWLPSVGTLRSITFHGPRAASHTENFRYNLATGTGVVADRLAAGDSYSIQAVVQPDTLPQDAAPYGTPTLDPAQDAFVAGRANQWSARADGVLAQAEAVAKYMHDHGAYSDGGPGEGEFRPGHSVNRLTSFLNGAQIVGDDEQYAAAYALICNYLGLPARVVLIAEPEADGTVDGKDVHTAVDVHIRTGSRSEWVMISRKQFMPEVTKKPNKRPPQTIQNANAAVVPPPNPVRPPSTLDQPDRPDQNTQHLAKKNNPSKAGLQGYSYVLVYYIGLPLLAILLICALIIGVKWRRRRRRRTRGSTPNRFEAGWREILDAARDLGAVVPGGRTRYEQAVSLGSRPAGDRAVPLAAAADAGIFGPGVPSDDAARRYWREVDSARRAMARGAGRFGRVRAALNLRSLRPQSGRAAKGVTPNTRSASVARPTRAAT